MKQTDEKGRPMTYWGGLEEPKQETLTYTESANKEERIFNSNMIKQEKMYSEEDVLNLLEFIKYHAIETSRGWQINGKEYSDKEIVEKFKTK